MLILGMSGLIVLFWFVGGGVALRYLVCWFSVFIVSERLIFLSRLCSSVSCHVCTRSGMLSVSHIFVLTCTKKNTERATF